jgi:hypothetical protein
MCSRYQYSTEWDQNSNIQTVISILVCDKLEFHQQYALSAALILSLWDCFAASSFILSVD